MHHIQLKLIALSEKYNLSELSYRKIGKLVGEDHPQLIKHHLAQLQKKGYLKNYSLNIMQSLGVSKVIQPDFISIPILGSANCGQATIYANESVQGYLQVSSSILRVKKNIFAIVAKGDSMNMADIYGNCIDDGDYVIVDYNNKTPINNDYVLSIINNCANIKKFVKDSKNKQILLKSESTRDYPPIVIGENESYLVNGKVVQVIKQA